MAALISSLNLPWLDVTTEIVTLIAVAVVFLSMWQLYRAYGRMIWLLPAIGTGIFLIGAIIDLLLEFNHMSHATIEVIEDLSTVAGISFFALGLLIIVRFLTGLAHTDPLTGIYNKRYLRELMHHQIEHAKRYHTSLTVVFIDIDRFKEINDTMGHITGDIVLRSVAQKLQDSIRVTDRIARFGGDEFVVIMPHTKLADSRHLVARLEKGVAALKLPVGHKLSFSFGAVEYPAHGENFEQLLAHASAQMYQHRTTKNGLPPR